MKKIFICIIILFLGLVSQPANAATATDCLDPINAGHDDCQPQNLRNVEETVVRIIYFAWVAGIPLFGLIGGYIGYQYMTSGADADKKVELSKRGTYWAIGLILFFASQPITAAGMAFFINDSTDCFDFADTPGFTFFFEQVCSGSSAATPRGCSASLDTYCVGVCTAEGLAGGPFALFDSKGVSSGGQIFRNVQCQCGGQNNDNKCFNTTASVTCSADADNYCSTLGCAGGATHFTENGPVTHNGISFRKIECSCVAANEECLYEEISGASGITPGGDGVGGCCAAGAVDPALGCFQDTSINTGAANFRIGVEQCTIDNGACSSGKSCGQTTVNGGALNSSTTLNDIDGEPCNADQDGRAFEIYFNDGVRDIITCTGGAWSR